MITFTCRNITNGTACTGHVRYTVNLVEMVDMFQSLKTEVNTLKAPASEVATHSEFKAAVSKLTGAAAGKKAARTKIIYLTCDAEAMHVESYEIPVK